MGNANVLSAGSALLARSPVLPADGAKNAGNYASATTAPPAMSHPANAFVPPDIPANHAVKFAGRILTA